MIRLGIALGGGGAKGAAHVVILEALDELGLRPQCVAGCSIGAILGGLYCAGVTGGELRERICSMSGSGNGPLRELLSGKHLFQWLDFIAPQFHGAGLLKSEAVLSHLFAAVPARTFEDLAIPLRVVAADFWSREEVVFDRGPLGPAIQASMALPGVFSPVIIGKRVLVDGGAVNPVPFDLLPANCDLTIAVDVIGSRSHSEGAVPSLSESIFNTFQIMEKSIIRGKLRASQPDVYVNVEVADVRVLEFHKARDVLEQADRMKEAFKRDLEKRVRLAEQERG